MYMLVTKTNTGVHEAVTKEKLALCFDGAHMPDHPDLPFGTKDVNRAKRAKAVLEKMTSKLVAEHRRAFGTTPVEFVEEVYIQEVA